MKTIAKNPKKDLRFSNDTIIYLLLLGISITLFVLNIIFKSILIF